MIIYADELILKNFLMSYLILIVVGEILSLKYRKRDLIFGSLVASVITLLANIYEINNNIFARTITICLMTFISFKPKEGRNFIVELAFILGVTFLIGGIMNSSINNSYEIIICGVISIVAFKKYNDYYKKKKWKIRNQYKLKFEIEHKNIELNAFLDTGNFLTTNLKGEPVIVISKESLKDKVSDKILNLLMKGEIGDLSFSILKNIRPINYLVLNEEMKMTYGLKVKNVKVENENKTIIQNAVIVLSENKIKESDAIIGINLLEGGMESGNVINIETKSKEIVY